MRRVQRRKCEMWVSTNKVLIGGNKKPHARNPNFETEETKLLISLWGDPNVQKTLITTHKKHPVIARLAEKMREHGYYRSPEEINTRIKNLKCFYNRIKKDLETGILMETTWKHFTAMDEILTRPIFGRPSQQNQLGNSNKGSNENGDNSEVSDDFERDESTSRDLRPEDLLRVEEKKCSSPGLDANGQKLLVPKEEPVDLDEVEDEEQEEEDVSDIFPRLSAYLQLASNNKGAPKPVKQKEMKIETRSKSNIPNNNPTSVPTSTPKTSQTQQQSSQNKISLVPTNFLLKQQQQQQQQQSPPAQPKLSIKPPQLINIGAAKAAAAANQQGQSVINANNGKGVPMKVLLVNTLQKSTSSSVPPLCTPTTATAQQSVLPQKLNTVSLTGTQPTPLPQKRSLEYDLRSGPSFKYAKGVPVLGFRTLLNQLVQLQTQNLEISKQRLDLDRQRLELERNVGGKLLDILTEFVSRPKEEKH